MKNITIIIFGVDAYLDRTIYTMETFAIVCILKVLAFS